MATVWCTMNPFTTIIRKTIALIIISGNIELLKKKLKGLVGSSKHKAGVTYGLIIVLHVQTVYREKRYLRAPM